MALSALRFGPASFDADPVIAALAIEPAGELAELRARGAPAAYVVRRDDLGPLRRCEGVVIDRHRKHPAKGLATLLLGYDKIPLIEGSYRDPGQLVRSVRTLLRNAVDRGETNLYVIGVDPLLFEQVRQRARAAEETAGSSAGASAVRGDGAGRHVARRDDEAWRAATAAAESSSPPLLSLLSRREVPIALVNRFVGRSPEAHLVRQLVLIAAEHDNPVLVLGSTGTGKEVVARAIHDYSDRRTQPFVPVNCGAIPPGLVESELFGHLPGAFTDAKHKDGLWKAAHRGTIFLDEIGDLPLPQQVKILRAIEERTIRPVGAEKEIKVDARVIAATNRDLFAMVQAGEFREDLYYRLRAFLVRTPALRDHPEDIPVLAEFFWRAITKDAKATLLKEVAEELSDYRWPGNARELRAVLTHLHTLFGGRRLAKIHLRAVFALEGQTPSAARPSEHEIDLYRVECLRHLRRADEVIQAIEVALAAIMDPAQRAGAPPRRRGRRRARRVPPDEGVSDDQLRRHHSELEVLCHRPLLFHGEAAYASTAKLRDVVAHLAAHAEDDPRTAAAYCKTEVEPTLRTARSTIAREVEQLVKRR